MEKVTRDESTEKFSFAAVILTLAIILSTLGVSFSLLNQILARAARLGSADKIVQELIADGSISRSEYYALLNQVEFDASHGPIIRNVQLEEDVRFIEFTIQRGAEADIHVRIIPGQEGDSSEVIVQLMEGIHFKHVDPLDIQKAVLAIEPINVEIIKQGPNLGNTSEVIES